jgi:WD repeat-containing protein 32
MPKWKNCHGDPYKSFLDARQTGIRTIPGTYDRLCRQMGQDLMQFPESKRFSTYFEQSLYPFYPVQKYEKGVFYRDQEPVGSPGGIFNVEFNPDGNILAAACERKSILVFDPLTRKIIRTIENAHSDCVNCIRFLDSRTFATCSDDTTVCLWDVRNLKQKVRTLSGHSNWVKNIEYSSRESILVTSGFDGAIFTWEINKYSDSSPDFNKVFYTNGLMRMRLTPDSSKMVISTMNGYLVTIHDLDLAAMSEDLAGFKPNMYRLMQLSGKALELAVNYTRLFHAKRNRVEIISDFPTGNDAEIISSLRLHPQGWVALSRNTSSDEATEWCCVHDIQSVPISEEDDELIRDSKPLMWRSVSSGEEGAAPPLPPPPDDENTQTFRSGGIEIVSTGRTAIAAASGSGSGNSSETGGSSSSFSAGSSSSLERDSDRPVITIDLNIGRRRRYTGQEAEGRRSSGDGRRRSEEEDAENDAEELEVDGASFLSADSLAALELIGEFQQRHRENQLRERLEQDQTAPSSAASDPRVPPIGGEGVINIVGAGSSVGARDGGDVTRNEQGGFLIIGPNVGPRGRGRVLYFGSPGARRAQQARIPKNARIHKNTPRLTHFLEESNTGRGFIKEQCFSPDGRFIASPFGYGVRLLGWDNRGSDLSSCVSDSPVRLYEIGTKMSHNEVVLSSAFSPCHWLLVTGCLSGRIVWHQPAL